MRLGTGFSKSGPGVLRKGFSESGYGVQSVWVRGSVSLSTRLGTKFCESRHEVSEGLARASSINRGDWQKTKRLTTDNKEIDNSNCFFS